MDYALAMKRYHVTSWFVKCRMPRRFGLVHGLGPIRTYVRIYQSEQGYEGGTSKTAPAWPAELAGNPRKESDFRFEEERKMAQARPRSTTAGSNATPKARSTRAKAPNKAVPKKARAATRGASNGARSKVASRPTKAKAASRPTKARVSTNGHGGSGAAKEVVTDAVGGAGSKVRRAAGSAKGPLLAGGAAVAGVVGGVALGAARGPRKLLGVKPTKPSIQIRSQDVARTAKEIGAFGEQLGNFAAEIRQTREAATASKHRSPVEVVLQALTARR